MTEQSAINRHVHAGRWRGALWWIGGLAAPALAVWAVTYAAYHAMAGVG
jgi:hypothetical protein